MESDDDDDDDDAWWSRVVVAVSEDDCENGVVRRLAGSGTNETDTETNDEKRHRRTNA